MQGQIDIRFLKLLKINGSGIRLWSFAAQQLQKQVSKIRYVVLDKQINKFTHFCNWCSEICQIYVWSVCFERLLCQWLVYKWVFLNLISIEIICSNLFYLILLFFCYLLFFFAFDYLSVCISAVSYDRWFSRYIFNMELTCNTCQWISTIDFMLGRFRLYVTAMGRNCLSSSVGVYREDFPYYFSEAFPISFNILTYSV